MIKKVFVAMSGGVDSSVAAALLKERGYDVRGVFMRTWSPEGVPCITHDDRFMAARAAAHIGIPFAVWDFRKEYKRAVVDYMTAEYAAGRTPNPDVMCNKQIKFGVFLQRAREQGADFIATGHYVRLATSQKPIANRETKHYANPFIPYTLIAARDSAKDQSYFLWTLTQEQLRHCLFPIGDYEKSEVRAMARARGLPNWDKKDSQGLCFVGTIDFAHFLRTLIPPQEGVVLTRSGERIGGHDGAQFVTVGQRHGLNLGIKNHELGIMGKHETRAHYVVEKDVATNTVVVAEEDDPLLYRKEIDVKNINWILGNMPQMPLKCLARIRYRQPLQESRIKNHESWGNKDKNNSMIHDFKFMIQFTEAQRAVAPGQSVVFYTKDDVMLGGGVIA